MTVRVLGKGTLKNDGEFVMTEVSMKTYNQRVQAVDELVDYCNSTERSLTIKQQHWQELSYDYPY